MAINPYTEIFLMKTTKIDVVRIRFKFLTQMINELMPKKPNTMNL